MTFVQGLVAAFAVISTLIIVSAIFSPLARRIGFRNVYRRMGNTFLVVMGSMVGAALITGSLVLDDSLNASFDGLVDKDLGEIDLQLTVSPKTQEPVLVSTLTESELSEVTEVLNSKELDLDGILPTLLLTVTPQKLDQSGEPVINSFNSILLGIHQDEIGKFGTNPVYLPSFESDDSAIFSQSLADKLELNKGDTVRIPYGDKTVEFTVQEIIAEQGIPANNSLVVSADYLAEMLDLKSGTYNSIYISADGGIEPNDYNGEEFQTEIESTLEGFSSERVEFTTQEVKSEALNGYGLGVFVNLFFALSLFGVIAGILLIVNLYSMLAEERKYEMGILRAIALTRLQLSKTFIYEGYIYSIVSSFLGALVGVMVGYLLTVSFSTAFAGILSVSGNEDVFKIVFAVEWQSLATGFVVGALITIITATVSSFRISNLNIVSAIRNTTEEKIQKLSIKWVLGTLAVIALLFIAVTNLVISFSIGDVITREALADLSDGEYAEMIVLISGYMRYLGTVLTVLITAWLLTRITHQFWKKDWGRVFMSIATINVLTFSSQMHKIDVISESLQQDAGIGIFFLSSLALVVSLVILISFNLDLLVSVISALFGWIPGATPIVRIAMRYPAANKQRTGITLTMFALIIYLIVFSSIDRALVNDQFEGIANNTLGGYSVMIIPGEGVSDDQMDEIMEAARDTEGINNVQPALQTQVILPEFTYGDLTPKQTFGPPRPASNDSDLFGTSLNGLPGDFLLDSEIELRDRAEGYDTDTDAWQEVIDNENKVILGEAFSSTDGYGARPDFEVGDFILITDVFGENSREVEVIGMALPSVLGPTARLYSDIITTNEHIDSQFSENYIQLNSSRTVLADIDDSADSGEVLNSLKKDLIDYNIAMIVELNEILGTILGFIDGLFIMLQGFLAFSLIVGTSGLAIIMTRSVQERRQQIGMLRSIGMQRNDILLSFFVESTLITLLGIVIGVSMAIVAMNGLILVEQVNDPDFQLVIPWGEILFICGLVYIWALLFALLPSIKASRLSPVEATNYPE